MGSQGPSQLGMQRAEGHTARERKQRRGRGPEKVVWGESWQGKEEERHRNKRGTASWGPRRPEGEVEEGNGGEGGAGERAGEKAEEARMASLMSHSALPLPRRSGC